MFPFFLRRLQKHQIVVASIVGVLSGVYMWKAPLEQYQQELGPPAKEGYNDIASPAANPSQWSWHQDCREYRSLIWQTHLKLKWLRVFEILKQNRESRLLARKIRRYISCLTSRLLWLWLTGTAELKLTKSRVLWKQSTDQQLHYFVCWGTDIDWWYGYWGKQCSSQQEHGTTTWSIFRNSDYFCCNWLCYIPVPVPAISTKKTSQGCGSRSQSDAC